MLEEYNDLISFNKIYVERLINVAVISAADAIDYNLTGPNLRGSGVAFDVRKDLPYSIYPELDFEVPIGTGERGTLGDCFDRYMVRIREIAAVVSHVAPVPRSDPRRSRARQGAAEVQAAGRRRLRPDRERARRHGLVLRERRQRLSAPRAGANGSFTAMSIVDHLSRGLMLADLIAVIASLDVVAPEVDR